MCCTSADCYSAALIRLSLISIQADGSSLSVFEADVQNGMAGQGSVRETKQHKHCSICAALIAHACSFPCRVSYHLVFVYPSWLQCKSVSDSKVLTPSCIMQTEFGFGVCLFSKDKVFLTYIRYRNERSL